jgi:hypothetical protein
MITDGIGLLEVAAILEEVAKSLTPEQQLRIILLWMDLIGKAGATQREVNCG